MSSLKTKRLLPALAIISLGLFSCEKQPLDSAILDSEVILYSSGEYCSDVYETDLIAGKNTVAGAVSVANDEDSLYVTYETTGGWGLDDIKLFVGDIEDLPLNKAGNPKLGQYPIKTSLSGETSYTVALALSSLDETVVVSAFAEVSKNNKDEGAWADGESTGGKSGAMYFEFTTEECEEDCSGVDTAWANGAATIQYTLNSTYSLLADNGDQAGSISLSAASGGYRTVTITLNSGWSLQSINNPVMAQAYRTPLQSKPDPGQFSGFSSYVGSNLSFTILALPNVAIAVAVESDELCD